MSLLGVSPSPATDADDARRGDFRADVRCRDIIYLLYYTLPQKIWPTLTFLAYAVITK